MHRSSRVVRFDLILLVAFDGVNSVAHVEDAVTEDDGRRRVTRPARTRNSGCAQCPHERRVGFDEVIDEPLLAGVMLHHADQSTLNERRDFVVKQPTVLSKVSVLQSVILHTVNLQLANPEPSNLIGNTCHRVNFHGVYHRYGARVGHEVPLLSVKKHPPCGGRCV